MREFVGWGDKIPAPWVRYDNERNTIACEIPLDAQAEIAFATPPGRRNPPNWGWIGGPGFNQDTYRMLIEKGDPDARSRLSVETERKLNYITRGESERVALTRSVVGAPVVPAAIAGHPLACVQRKLMPLEAECVWIDAGLSCTASAREIWDKCTPQLAQAVAKSRTRPVVAVVYLAVTGMYARPQGYENGVIYTKMAINPYSWSRLSQLAHPSWMRGTALNAINLLCDDGHGYECGRTGLPLHGLIGDPAKWFTPDRVAQTRTKREQ